MRRTEDIWRCSYNQCANAITVCFCYKSTVSYSSDGDVIVKCFVVRIAIQKLSDYYGSKQWRKDLEAEEQGLFPEGLKRGILSEGGIYNLLERNKEIMEALRSYLTEDK